MNKKIYVKITQQPYNHYPIIIGKNLHTSLSWLPENQNQKIVIITDFTVKRLYAMKLLHSLIQAGYSSLLFAIPAGEKYKNNHTKQKIENKMLAHHCDKSTLVLAVGGGVVGDLAGFIAATYLRGIPYIQLPTTLLAMVDSSVGGKTAINTFYGKNMIGTIYQPTAVIADITTLISLPKKHMINGLIEAIKIFIMHDKKIFTDTKSQLNNIVNMKENYLQNIIINAIKIKAAVVEEDEKEQGVRNILNFGHTIGHALEKMSNFNLLHGYAVAYGILVETTISHILGLLATPQLQLIKNLLSFLGIHGNYLKKFNIHQLIQTTKYDKKVKNGEIHYTLLSKIGSPYIFNGSHTHPVADNIVKQAFKNAIEG